MSVRLTLTVTTGGHSLLKYLDINLIFYSECTKWIFELKDKRPAISNKMKKILKLYAHSLNDKFNKIGKQNVYYLDSNVRKQSFNQQT